MTVVAAPRPTRGPRFSSRQHDDENAAWLGLALGVCFTICFVTGVVSHLVQDPGSWFHWPARPAGLYRLNQGLHVTTGIAAIPLLLTKLWVVFPKLFAWPPFRSVAQAVERGLIRGPRLFFSGRVLSQTGGHGDFSPREDAPSFR